MVKRSWLTYNYFYHKILKHKDLIHIRLKDLWFDCL